MLCEHTTHDVYIYRSEEKKVIRREKVRRKKMEKREKVGKS
jgi:hypothetical protein